MAHHGTSGSNLSEPAETLELFEPLVAKWFRRRIGEPTEVQRLAWPRIATGEHVLVSAPTGSGKTLTAFLWSINQLLAGTWSAERLRVLYVSPLRALNTDIQRNLIKPLSELQTELVAEQGESRPIRVLTRSGDTPNADRQRMIRHPPEILITTPESLNILLTSKGGRSILGDLQCVILDEIHAVAGSKRGTHLITAVERLSLLSGEFQRLGLSATVRPAERIARFVGGYQIEAEPEGDEPVYRRRKVAVVASSQTKKYEISVESKLTTNGVQGADGVQAERERRSAGAWDPLIDDLKDKIAGNRSTLLFANSRRLTEKVTRLINEGEKPELAYSHHGSLSREIRGVVEERLKEGRLAAIVATNSLELGIDIGALDEVVLIQTPPSISAAVQRLGRAGHGVGETSRGRFYPLHERDLLNAVVVARGVRAQDIEEIHPVIAPLDVLAQVIVSMVAAQPWQVEDLYRFIRTSDPYRNLSRRQFDLVVEMLSGRYADNRIRELDPRLTFDRLEGMLRPKRGAPWLIYTSGGTIPDRGYFHLRLKESRSKLGELDEEFVWERSIGDTFTLGAQSWEITGITHNDVLVRPARRSSAMAPFWRADERDRSFHLSQSIGGFLEEADTLLDQPDGVALLTQSLRRDEVLTPSAIAAVVGLVQEQKAATSGALPHRRHVLVERVRGEDSAESGNRVVVHTFWGGRVNRPLALALSAVWAEENKGSLQIEHDNDCLMLLLPDRVDPMQLLRRVQPDNLERLLRASLESSGFFGARFRENSGRALLLPRGGLRRRVPLWFNRQRAKKLLGAVSKYGDFPMVLETWRTCLQDEFDLESLARVLTEIESGETKWSEVFTTTPSPFAAEIVWKRTNRLMYEDDAPDDESRSKVGRDLLRELVHDSRLRPPLSPTLIAQFERKLQRTHPGYAPRSADELIEWIHERVVVGATEWKELLAAVERDAEIVGPELEDRLEKAAERLVWISLADADSEPGVAHIETVLKLARCFDVATDRLIEGPLVVGHEVPAIPESLLASSETEDDSGPDPLIELIAEWIRFYGPLNRGRLTSTWGFDSDRLDDVLESLVAADRLVIDQFRPESADIDELEICDSENLERLLRLLRAEARPVFKVRPAEELPVFLAHQQGLIPQGSDPRALMSCLERLFGFPARVELWEAEFFPARLEPYYSDWLDSLFQETQLTWLGQGKEKVTFGLAADVDLFGFESIEPIELAESNSSEAIFPPYPGRYRLEELVRASGQDSASVSRRLWEMAWLGRASNTTFSVVRRGAMNRFKPSELPEKSSADSPGPRRHTLARRARFERWSSTRPTSGEWFLVPSEADDQELQLDALDAEELNKDRVRVLLQRYGILFRDLLERESPAFRWSKLFRSMRLMELSGEILCGHFFEGIPGLQFISTKAFQDLKQGLPSDEIFWTNATDSASPCGLRVEGLSTNLPARRASTHLVYHGRSLVVVSQRQGGSLDIRVAVDHPGLADYFGFLKVLLTRQISPRRGITIETINGGPAATSPYAEVLAEILGVIREAGSLKLRKTY